MAGLEGYLLEELERLEAEGLRRLRPASVTGAGLVDVCSNDYLGYARRGVSRETSPHSPPGAGASRHIHGTTDEHLALEAELADWVRAPAAVLFPSGYAANLGALSALLAPGDVVISDRLNHASLIDGCRLARAKVTIVPNANAGAVADALRGAQSNRRWVVTESYFSMDGTSPDLRALRSVCDDADAALYVDEAHALGVFGPRGAGLCQAAGVVPDVLVGTLGKAVGVQGAFVAGSEALADFLWNRARSLVFTTAPSPTLAATTLAHARAVRMDDARRARLGALSELLSAELGPSSVRLPGGRHGPIFPVVLGDPQRALDAARALRDHGYLAQAIRPPTVPAGTSRLRIALSTELSEGQVRRLGQLLRELCAS